MGIYPDPEGGGHSGHFARPLQHKTETNNHTHVRANLESPMNQWGMFLDCGMKPENPYMQIRTWKAAELEFELMHFVMRQDLNIINRLTP